METHPKQCYGVFCSTYQGEGEILIAMQIWSFTHLDQNGTSIMILNIESWWINNKIIGCRILPYALRQALQTNSTWLKMTLKICAREIYIGRVLLHMSVSLIH